MKSEMGQIYKYVLDYKATLSIIDQDENTFLIEIKLHNNHISHFTFLLYPDKTLKDNTRAGSRGNGLPALSDPIEFNRLNP